MSLTITLTRILLELSRTLLNFAERGGFRIVLISASMAGSSRPKSPASKPWIRPGGSLGVARGPRRSAYGARLSQRGHVRRPPRGTGPCSARRRTSRPQSNSRSIQGQFRVPAGWVQGGYSGTSPRDRYGSKARTRQARRLRFGVEVRAPSMATDHAASVVAGVGFEPTTFGL